MKFIQSMVKYEGDAISGWLLCPNCNGNNLHHTWIREYIRENGAEDGETCVTQLLNGKVTDAWEDRHRNPSSRRDGIRIGMYCECCSDHIELVISQHKGCTELRMEHLPDGLAVARLVTGQ